jgi:NADPH:quinone reductase-like Zn-dependent oxidoreductase
MKAVVFEAPNTLKIKEVKTPRPGDNEVVVKVGYMRQTQR